MMLPEHKECIQTYRQSLNKRERPVLCEQQIEQLSYKIAESMTNHKRVTVLVYDPYEQKMVRGTIQTIDRQLRRLKLLDGDDVSWIAFDDIMDIS